MSITDETRDRTAQEIQSQFGGLSGDVGQVGQALGVSRQTVYRLVRSKSIPHFRTGDGTRSTVRFWASHLADWIVDQANYAQPLRNEKEGGDE